MPRRTRIRGVLSRLALVLGTLTFGLSAIGRADVAFPGRVIDLESRRPIAGADIAVTIRASSVPHVAPIKIALKTDGEGRFTLNLPADEPAGPRRSVAIRVSHPRFISRLSPALPISRLVAAAERGWKSRFESIALESGVEYSLSVVSPENRPVPGVRCEFGMSVDNNPDSLFSNDEEAMTDARGVGRVRMTRARSAYVTLSAPGFATLHHSWDENEQEDKPREDLPADLGRLTLTRGVRLAGRVLDLKGKPIAGFGVEARCQDYTQRSETRTDAAGLFAFEHLHEGTYTVHAAGQGGGDSDSTIDPERTRTIRPCIAILEADRPPPELVVREVEMVKIKARFVDSAGRPVTGGQVSISGTIPGDPPPVRGFQWRRLVAVLAGVDPPEEEAPRVANHQWWLTADPDPDGRVEIRAPKGLVNASISVQDDSGTVAYRLRLAPKEEPSLNPSGGLGQLDADRDGIEFIAYRSPTFLVHLRAEDGRLAPDESNVAAYLFHNGNYQNIGDFEQVAPGTFRGFGLMPDAPFMVFANSATYITSRVEGIKIPEGGCGEVALMLARKPEPAKVGDLAPPILVTTSDGQVRSLADYQGRHVLLVMWSMQFGSGDLAKINAIRDKFGKGEKFAILGLNYDVEPKTLEAAIKSEKLKWPSARLGAAVDPIMAAYGWEQRPTAILIGPDGTILAKDLNGDEIEKAVADRVK